MFARQISPTSGQEKTMSDRSLRELHSNAGYDSDPIHRLRLLCLSRGANGILALGRMLRRMDGDGNRQLKKDEFIDGLRETGLELTDEEATKFFEKFDVDHNGSIDMSEFLVHVRNPLPMYRKNIIEGAFTKMDKTNKGVIRIEDLKKLYDVTSLPKYISGNESKELIANKFLEHFDHDATQKGMVTFEEFLNYYSGISSSIEDDCYFDLIMRQCYKMVEEEDFKTDNKEQYLFNVFEAIISTLETKLQRIENLDKAVEHLMRRVEGLDSRVNNNIDKTDSVIAKLSLLDTKLFNGEYESAMRKNSDAGGGGPIFVQSSSDNANLGRRLVSLDQKVSDIDNKLNVLKNQLDNNFLQGEDINAEASEKKPISMNVVEITKALNTEVINHVTKELGQLREATGGVDRKLQFHINLVSENLGKVLHMMTDVHHAIVDDVQTFITINRTTTTTPMPEVNRSNKIDALVQQMRPIISVSEKMDEVWDVVVGTKSSVDDLVPKSDELLTQTQRQERAIGEIHNDLRTKTNKIIANLDKVEKRLKKQEDDVATLAQRPVPAELLLDPTIDRLVEYDPSRYVDEYSTDTTLPVSFTTLPPPTTITQSTTTPNHTSSTTPMTSSPLTSTEKRAEKRKGGVIFPSVKNKPSPANTTFATELLANIKDVKGYSCVDLLNAGMRDSGVYYLQIRGTTYWFLKVFCEQEVAEGGWTVIQRRDDFGDPRENFNRDWNDYKNGFGDPAKEFWLGNENIYMLTNNEEYILRVELEDFEGNKRYAQYSHFKIFSEGEYYKLEIDGYEGNAGDSLNDPWYGSNNSPFSTYNRDNDRSSLNCASMLKGGWWWKSCGRGLNGLYLNDPQDLTARQGIVWFRWRGWDYTLKKAMMMIKPKGLVSTT